MTTKHWIWAAATLAAAAAQAFADGSRLPNQDALAVARGYAFVATADDPSAVYYNPSGLALQPAGEVAGAFVIAPSDSYQGSGGKVDEKGGTFVLPHIFADVPVAGVTLGVGLFEPFGLQTDWPENSGFRNIATTNKLYVTSGALSLAKQIAPQLAVGASFEVEHLSADLARGIGYTPGDLLTYDGTGTCEGWNAGLMWTPSPENQFGIMYESRANFHLSGNLIESPYGVNETGTGSWAFPDHLAFGYSYRPAPAWNLEADADWTHWALLKTVTVAAPTGLITLPFFYNNSWYYNFGATRYWKSNEGKFSASLGYSWSGNSVPDTYYTPALPDMTRNLVTLGGSFETVGWKLSLALERGLSTSRTVTGAIPSPTGQQANGTYYTSFNALDLTEQYRW
jgi:long-chain fatty acid transport protein